MENWTPKDQVILNLVRELKKEYGSDTTLKEVERKIEDTIYK